MALLEKCFTLAVATKKKTGSAGNDWWLRATIALESAVPFGQFLEQLKECDEILKHALVATIPR